MPSAPGTELAPGYLVLAHLNRGNRLDVYDAWSMERESRCVLKTLRPERASESRPARALRQEGRLLMRLAHPHLVRAYEVVRAADDARPVLVLETLGGETLSHLLHRLDEAGRRLPLAEVAVLGLQLASAVGYLHRHGWLHLDLKPTNIVVEAGRACLIDLSVARRPGRARAGTGTFEYMSPEQARGGVLTPAADVWGLGGVLHAALVAEPPYGYDATASVAASEPTGAVSDSRDEDSTGIDTGASAENLTDTGPEMSADDATGVEESYPQLEGDVPPIRDRRRLPADLASLIDACLRRDPLDRPTLPELSRALDDFLAARTGSRYLP